MKKKMLIGFLLALMLVGCEQAGDSGQAGQLSTDIAQSGVPKNTIFFADGSGIELSGKVVRDSVALRSGINIRRVVVLFEDELQSIDTSLYGVLKQVGYSKKVISSTSTKIVVVYSKKGFPALRAHFDVIQQGKKKSSRLILRWQV